MTQSQYLDRGIQEQNCPASVWQGNETFSRIRATPPPLQLHLPHYLFFTCLKETVIVFYFCHCIHANDCYGSSYGSGRRNACVGYSGNAGVDNGNNTFRGDGDNFCANDTVYNRQILYFYVEQIFLSMLCSLSFYPLWHRLTFGANFSMCLRL
jgi:hypothetical protein